MLLSKRELFSFLFIVSCVRISSAGGVSSVEDLNEVADDHINRLLSLRQSDMGWYNTPSAVLALQLSKQRGFIGRNLSVHRMKKEVLNENISLGKLALYAMATTSVCENPRKFSKINLIEKIKNKLKVATRNRDTIIWYDYALAIQALCVNNARIRTKEILTILSSKNQNGGYGPSVDTTSQMLIAFKCMSEQSSLPHEMQRRVEEAVQLAGDYLEQQYNHDMGSLWIGNKYSTPIALSALQAVNRPLNSLMKNEVYESLQSCVFDDEPEGAVAQRLTALHNTTVLQLRHWPTCSPVTVSASTVTSQPEDFEDFPITIEVSLTVEVGSETSTIVVEDVEKFETLLQVMERARNQENFRFTTRNTAWGPSIVSINDVEVNSSMRQYWSLIDANKKKSLTVGIGQYIPSQGDHILFRLSTY